MHNIYNDLTYSHGNALIRVNGNEYDARIDNISCGDRDTVPEFSGYLMNLTPKVNYSNFYKRGTEESRKLYMGVLTPPPTIRQVLFRDPSTIVFWADGTKTVVKAAEGDIYDPEKGLAMVISKKALGDQVTFHRVFKKWLPEEKEKENEI